MKVLIAGCGYLGREIAEQLLKRDHEVIGLTHTRDSAAELCTMLGFQVEACDLGDEAALRALRSESRENFDAIVHCASSGRRGADQYRRVYHQGCVNLCAVFPESTILFTSSTSVYPQVDGEVIDETSLSEPSRETGQILLEAEQVVLTANGIVARLAGLYGPGRSVILQRFLNGSAIIETGESRFLNQTHRDDAASAIVAMLESKDSVGEIYNVCDGKPTSLQSTYEGLANYFSQSPPPEGPRDLNRKRGWTHKQIQNQKLRALGWLPRYPSFLDAVREDKRLVSSIQEMER